MPVPLVARSLLFAPGDSDRKIAKAAASDADLVLLDLEDSVAESNKSRARETVADHLHTADRGNSRWVRINPLDSLHALADLAAIVAACPDGIMLPKATRADADRLHHYLTALEAAAGLAVGGISTMVVATETAQAVFGLGNYAGTPRLAALTWGAEDSAAAFGASSNRAPDGTYDFPYQMLRALTLVGACAAGVAPIETIHTDFRDLDGLAIVAAAARRGGFRGMLAIHPDQVPVINAAFSPSTEEIARAERIVALFAANPDAGTIGMDGAMIDLPHLKQARALLALPMRRAPAPGVPKT